MVEPERQQRRPRLTARGETTKARIVHAAVELMYVRGVAATTLDDVRAASNTSKSQLYQHFRDKDALVHEILAAQASDLLAREVRQLRRLDSIRGIERWRDAIVTRNALHDGAYGCQLGSLAGELADKDDDARTALAKHFETWEGLFVTGLERMRESGVLRRDADPAKLATGLMAALQGGYVLAQTAHDTAPMLTALNMAIDHIRIFQR